MNNKDMDELFEEMLAGGGNKDESIRLSIKPSGELERQQDNNISQKGNKKSKHPQKLIAISAVTLSKMNIPPIKYIVDDILAPGLNILAGAPKTGKSWLVLDLAIKVANGDDFLGHKTRKCDVVYLALEDSEGRLKERQSKILNGKSAPSRLHFIIDADTIKNGLISSLEEYIFLHPQTGLIIIDTFQKVRGNGKVDNQYAADYEDTGAIKKLADNHNISILIIHHTNKGTHVDPYNAISGTTGITGAADASFLLIREKTQSQEALLSGNGRDIEMFNYMVRFDKSSCTWSLISDDADSYIEKIECNNNPIYNEIQKLLVKNSTWSGKMSDLYNELCNSANDQVASNVSVFSRNLKKIKRSLNQSGIEYKIEVKSDATHITLKKIAPLPPDKPQTIEDEAI